MAMLSDIFYRAPLIDLRTGLVTRPWAQLLQQLWVRVGGSGDIPTLGELSDPAWFVTPPEAAQEAQAARVAVPPGATPLTHLRGGPLAPPSVVVDPAGAGASASAAIAGTDTAGTVTLTTQPHDTRQSNSAVLSVTFAVPYATPPVGVLMPANDEAWGLLFGRFLKDHQAASVRLRQADITTTGFSVRCGVTTLPQERSSTTYAWNYHMIGA